MQGMMAFYFWDGDEWYTIIAHHALFYEDEGNDVYNYISKVSFDLKYLEKGLFAFKRP